MYRFRNFIIISCLIFLPVNIFAQDITGLWKGIMHNDTTGQDFRYEIAISEINGKLTGYSQTFFIQSDKEYFGLKKVKIKKQDDKIIIQDQELISNNYPIPPAKGVHQLNILTLEIHDSIMILSGPFSTNPTKEYHSLTGSIKIQRKNNYWQSALVPHLEELGLTKNLSFIPTKIPEEIKPVDKKENLVKTNNETIINSSTNKSDSIIKTQPIVNTGSNPEKDNLTKTEIKTASVNKSDSILKIQSIVKTDSKTKKENIVNTKPQTITSSSIKTQATVNVENENLAKIKPEIKDAIVHKPDTVVKTQPVVITESKSAKENNNETTNPQKTVDNEMPVIVKTIPGGPIPAADISKRQIETIQSVYFKTDSLVLTLYDNGEVDGDTVSVLMNGKVIMPMVGLSTVAVRKTIYITEETPDSILLIMYAENLGSIPPNTGLLVVHDGEDIYEIRFSGDYQKNAAILFKRKK